MLKVTFCGAARTVTGSMYYLEYQPKDGSKFRFCIDSGMFQVGSKMSLFRTNSHLLFDPKYLDCVVLTHAHLDHCGRLPYLIKSGFGGKIYSTKATKDIAEVVMRDAARISTDDPEIPQFFFREKGLAKKDLDGLAPADDQNLDGQDDQSFFGPRENMGLYQDYHVDMTVLRFKTFEYHEPFQIHPNLEIEFYDAGHILGSSYVVITEISSGKKIVFSGDLGNRNKPIVEDPELSPNLSKVSHIFVETTYGNRLHGDLDPKAKLRDIAFKTLTNKGQVLIPSFSVERAQEIIYYLIELMRENLLPQVPVFLDSPMASKVLKIVLDHPELFDKDLQQRIDENQHPLVYSRLQILETSAESKTLNVFKGPCIIIAGSGMLNGGRIIKHLKFHLENPKNVLIFVGYQAEGTLGRKVLEGENEVEIEHKKYKVLIQKETINQFSAHADQKILRDWLDNLLLNNLENESQPTVFLVHGEKVGSDGLKEEIEKNYPGKVKTYWPFFGEEVELWQ